MGKAYWRDRGVQTPEEARRGITGVEINSGEKRLLARIRLRWQELINAATRYSSVAAEFLAALIANESAGDAKAARFEPVVYRRLQRVASGKAARYGSVTRERIDAEAIEMLHPKTAAFHAAFLTQGFASTNSPMLATSGDDTLRDLATSWGLTQIMGYHMAGRKGTPRDLLEPEFNCRVALELLAEFASRYELDLARDFEPMFRCWNTGQPYGTTTDPAYVEKGLRRMEIYRAAAAQ